MNIQAVAILGSHRAKSNTEVLLNYLVESLQDKGVECLIFKLRELNVIPCKSCRRCLSSKWCVIDDDLTNKVFPNLVETDIIIIATPTYFDNVSTLTKIFMDRTWSLRGLLRNKVLGAVVVGRGYGLDTALNAIHNWALKHRMIIGDRGVTGRGFEYCEVIEDESAIRACEEHADRLKELAEIIKRHRIK